MLDIKQELEMLLLLNRLSMRKVIELVRDKGFDIPHQSTISTLLNNKRIRFETVQQILDYLGYELIIREKQNNNMRNKYCVLGFPNTQYENSTNTQKSGHTTALFISN